MDPRLSAIIELQQVLSEQRDIQAEYDRIPARRAEIDAVLGAVREEIARTEEEIKQREIERNSCEMELKNGQETRVKKESQLHAIKNEKEYKATVSEIETLDRKNTRLEEKTIALMEGVDTLRKTLEEKQAELERKKASFEDELRELDNRESTLTPRMEEAKTSVDQVVKRVRPDLYRRFLTVFEGKQGQAIATANDGHCGMCNMRLTPRVMQIAKRGQDIVQCESCARFLYWDQSLEEEQLGAL